MYDGRYEINVSSFFSENVIVATMKFTWMIHTPFAVMRLFSYTVSSIFNTILTTLSKSLETNVATVSYIDFGAHYERHKEASNCDNAS
jgi:hypothetical protein